MNSARRHVAFALATLLCACGSSEPTGAQGTGSVRLVVSGEFLESPQATSSPTSVETAISNGPDRVRSVVLYVTPLFAGGKSVAQPLSFAPSTGKYEGQVVDMKVGDYTFQADALASDGTVLFTGQQTFTVSKKEIGLVALMLQQVAPVDTIQVSAPRITSLTVSNSAPAFGEPLTLSLTAENRNATGSLAYTWEAVCEGDDPSGTVQFSDRSNSTTELATTCNSSVFIIAHARLNEELESAVATRVRYTTQGASASVELNSWPDITSIGSVNGQGEPGWDISINAVAKDDDGDALSYAWDSSCGGAFTNGDTATPVFHVPSAISDADGACMLTLTVSDRRGGSTSGEIVIWIGVAQTPETPPVTAGRAAIVVDQRLYSLLRTELETYRSKAQARRAFGIDLIPVTGIDDVSAGMVRDYVKGLRSLNPALEGILFVGNIKLPSFFQSRGDNLDVRLLPRYLEDLDGMFRKDLADGAIIPDCAGTFGHCYVNGSAAAGAHDFDYTAKGPNPDPEIWASFMPVGISGTANTYEDFAAQLRPYLQKVIRYYDGQITPNGRFYYVSNDIGDRMDQNWITFGPTNIDYYGKAGPAGETGATCLHDGINFCYLRWPTESYATYAALRADWLLNNPGEGWQQDSVFLSHMTGTTYSVVEVNTHANWVWSILSSEQARNLTGGGLIVALDGCGVAALSQPGSPSSTDVPGFFASDNVLLSYLYGSSEAIAGSGDPFTRGHYANHPTVWSRMITWGDYLGKAHFERMKVNYTGADPWELREVGAEMLVGDPFVDLN